MSVCTPAEIEPDVFLITYERNTQELRARATFEPGADQTRRGVPTKFLHALENKYTKAVHGPIAHSCSVGPIDKSPARSMSAVTE